MSTFFESWPWYVSGPLIGLFVPLFLLIGNKLFGISSSFDNICDMLPSNNLRSKIKFNTKNDGWKIYFSIGILVGAFVSVNFLSSDEVQFLPSDYYSAFGFLELFLGGVLVGFGTRYAGGCTSGHSITGISLLNTASIKATVAFFVGGLLYTYINYFLF